MCDSDGICAQVKEDMPAEYDTFLEVLTQFRSQSVNAEMVVTVVAEMLVGRSYLLEDFSNFLPPACRDILLERYTDAKDACSPRLADANLSKSSIEEIDAKGCGSDGGSPLRSDNCNTKSSTKSRKKAAQSGPRVDRSHHFVADMPVEPKRKRENHSEMDLRPARPLLLNSYAGMGKTVQLQNRLIILFVLSNLGMTS